MEGTWYRHCSKRTPSAALERGRERDSLTLTPRAHEVHRWFLEARFSSAAAGSDDLAVLGQACGSGGARLHVVKRPADNREAR
jgi:hypothetical protein